MHIANHYNPGANDPRERFREKFDLNTAGDYLYDEARQLLESPLACPTHLHKNGRYVLFKGLAEEGQLSVDGYLGGRSGVEDVILITGDAFRLKWRKQSHSGWIEVPRNAPLRDPTILELKSCADAFRMLRPLALALLPTPTRDEWGELTAPRRPSFKRECEIDIAIQGQIDKLSVAVNPRFVPYNWPRFSA